MTEHDPFWTPAVDKAWPTQTTPPAAFPGESRWCPECHRREPVLDTHTETWDHAGRELGCVVTDLVCGHQVQGHTAETGQPLPGAPYAGVTTAASPRLRDLAAADQADRARTERGA